jgi:hypothetical protein
VVLNVLMFAMPTGCSMRSGVMVLDPVDGATWLRGCCSAPCGERADRDRSAGDRSVRRTRQRGDFLRFVEQAHGRNMASSSSGEIAD